MSFLRQTKPGLKTSVIARSSSTFGSSDRTFARMVSGTSGLVCRDESLIVGGGDIIVGRCLALRLNLR